MTRPRYLPEKEFPPYRFVPGKALHPEKNPDHPFSQQQLRTGEISLQNAEYLYGIDLFNHQYFWESHVYFEALWNVHGRKGKEADFLKGLIKFAAAGVKDQLGQASAKQGHIQRGIELMAEVGEENFYGVNLKDLVKQVETAPDPYRPLIGLDVGKSSG